MALKFYTSVTKGLKLKDRKFWGLISTFVDITGEKLIGWSFCLPPHPPPIRNRVKNPHNSDISVAPKLIGDYQFKKVKFKGIYLKQDSVSFLHKIVLNFCISYQLDTWSRHLNTDFTLFNCLFRAVKLTKGSNPDKYE